EEERQTGRPYHTLVRLKEEPDLTAAQLAARLDRLLGRPFTEEAIRQMVHRGRLRFADLLVEETARALQPPGRGPAEPEEVEQRLIDLGLLNYYVRHAVQRYALISKAST